MKKAPNLIGLLFDIDDGGKHVPPKRRLTSTGYTVIYLRIHIIITTAVRTSDPTNELRHHIIAPYRPIIRCVMALIKQHVVTASAFKLGTLHLASYTATYSVNKEMK
jgi:hypothetical protein